MHKIIQARLPQYVNQDLPDVQAGFRRGRRTRDQVANIHWIMEKAREFQKNIYFCFIDYIKAFDRVDHNKPWKILRDGNTRPTYLFPEQPVWGSIRNKRLVQNWERTTARPYAVTLFMSLYAEYIMQNAGWMTHKLESILPGELPQTWDKQIIPPYWQKMKRN